MLKVGYSPPSDLRPHIPKEIVTERDDPDSFHRGVANGDLTVVEMESIQDESWLVLDETPAWIPIGELESWRQSRAKKLLEEMGALKGDPLRVLQMAKAAAALQEINLPDLIADLRSKRADEGEGPAAVFARVRGIPPGGRKA